MAGCFGCCGGAEKIQYRNLWEDTSGDCRYRPVYNCSVQATRFKPYLIQAATAVNGRVFDDSAVVYDLDFQVGVYAGYYYSRLPAQPYYDYCYAYRLQLRGPLGSVCWVMRTTCNSARLFYTECRLYYPTPVWAEVLMPPLDLGDNDRALCEATNDCVWVNYYWAYSAKPDASCPDIPP